MEVDVAKVLIIFGLLFSTMVAGLLPLLCLKIAAKNKANRGNSCEDDCYGSHGNGRDCQETKAMVRNGSVPTDNYRRPVRKSKKKLIISVLNCFAGGIFLGTSFIGLLPEIRECFSQFDIKWPLLYASSDNHTLNSTGTAANEQKEMPIAEIIVVGGLFLILCIEQAAHSLNHYREKKAARKLGNPVVALRMNNLGEEVSEGPTLNGEAPILESEPDVERPPHNHSSLRSLILVATLSVHSLLEGVAIGLQNEVQNVVTIFIAVLFHKSLMAFSMGTNLVHSKQTVRKIVSASAIFAFASPIGIAVGLIIKSFGGNNSGTEFINAILQAIATGTFLYITFFEVLVKEFESHGNRFSKVVALFVGYGSVLGTFFANNG